MLCGGGGVFRNEDMYMITSGRLILPHGKIRIGQLGLKTGHHGFKTLKFPVPEIRKGSWGTEVPGEGLPPQK